MNPHEVIRSKGPLTLEAEGHLSLEVLEVLGHGRLGFSAHLLASPLEGAVKFLGDIHLGGDFSLQCV